MIERILSNDRIWDLCIVGTGPVGMALAMEFERFGDEVLVLESGGRKVDPATAECFAGPDRGSQSARCNGNCGLQSIGWYIVDLGWSVCGLRRY